MPPTHSTSNDANPSAAAEGPVESSLEAILSQLPSGVVALDRAGKPCYASPSALEALGASGSWPHHQAEVEELTSSPRLTRALLDTVSHGRERRLTVLHQRPGGRVVELGIALVPATGPAAESLSALLLFRALDDVRALDERRQRFEQLAAAAQMAAGLAHEIRNPIAAIQGLAELLQKELEPSDPRAEYVERMLRQTARIEALIRRCLQLGEAPTARKAIEPRALVRQALDQLSIDRGLKVTQAPGVGTVWTDGQQTVECLAVLLANALEACDHQVDRVEVRIRPGTELASTLVEVANRGPQIRSQLVDRIFEPFFTTKSGAIGLGLPTARLLAFRNDASVGVSSSAEETVFTLSLPVSQHGGEA